MGSDLALLSEKEWRHIDAMNERFSYLKGSFETALSIPAGGRYEWAVEQLKKLPRSGPLFCGVPEQHVKSIHAHIMEMHALARAFARCAIPPALEELTEKMIAVHDLPEAITRDFHRHDPIRKDEKRKLEDSALKILLEHDPDGLRLMFHRFEAATHPAAQWAKDLDYLQCMHRTLEYQVQFPSLRPNLEEFWDDAHEKRLRTETGQKMLASLLEQRKILLF